MGATYSTQHTTHRHTEEKSSQKNLTLNHKPYNNALFGQYYTNILEVSYIKVNVPYTDLAMKNKWEFFCFNFGVVEKC